MRTRIAGGLFVSHLWSETDLKSHNKEICPFWTDFIIITK